MTLGKFKWHCANKLRKKKICAHDSLSLSEEICCLPTSSVLSLPNCSIPRFPGSLLIRSQCPDTSLKITLLMKAQHEGALTPPGIVRRNPQVPHTAREVTCHPVNNWRGNSSSPEFHSSTQDEAWLSCSNSAAKLRSESDLAQGKSGEETWVSCLQSRWGPLPLHRTQWCFLNSLVLVKFKQSRTLPM